MTHRIRLLTACAGLLLFFVVGIPLQAADFTAGTVQELIDAINDANATLTEADTITLTDNITLTVVDNNADLDGDTNSDGANGLPAITTEITINGAGYTIERSTAATTPPLPLFRIFGVADDGDLTLNNVTVSNGSAGNEADGDGGGIDNLDGTVTVSNSTLSNNTAGRGGGMGNARGTMTVSNSTISDNFSDSFGGGIYNNVDATLEVSNSTISGNTAQNNGGGISNFEISSSGGRVTVSNSTISGNTAQNDGGGIYHAGGGTMTVRNSTISDNTAQRNGGGISSSESSITLVDSTVSGNTATIDGGGIDNRGNNSPDLTLRNSTISNNRTLNGDGGGICSGATQNSTLQNSILANNTNGDYACRGPVNAIGNNIVADGTITTTGVINNDPQLEPLGNYGGPTQTHALVSSSPAIDASGTGATSADQRGAPAVNTRDIGAYEFGGAVPTLSFTVDETTLTESGTITQATVTLIFANFSTPFDDVSFTFTGDVTGDDYETSYSGPYIIGGSTAMELFTIDIRPDALTEGAETLNLELLILGTAGITGTNPQAITFLDEPPPTEEPPPTDVPPTQEPPPADDSPLPGQQTFIPESVEELPQTGESPFWRNWLLMAVVLLGGAGGTLLLLNLRPSDSTR